MEEKLHNDGLEDFLKKAFDQYDDSPSDGLWDKIESNLDSPVAVVPMYKQWHLWASAAAIFLLAVVVGQHFYYGQKLDRLAQKIETTNENLNSLKTENDELKQALELTKKDIRFQESTLLETPENQLATQEKSTQQAATVRQPDQTKAPNQNSSIVSTTPQNEANFENTLPLYSPKENTLNPELASPPVMEAPAHLVSNLSNLASLNLKEVVGAATLPALNLEVPKITPQTQRPRFSLGIHRTEMATNERISRTIQRPNPMNDQRIFTGHMTNRGNTSITGFSAAMDLKKGWFLESGINLRSTTFNIQHSAQLQFRDRMVPPMNPPGNDYRFDYALSTASGLMGIEVRASQTDPSHAIGEDENIRIDISTEHDIQYVSLPLLVGHRFGHGRLNFEIQAGLMANFLTDNTFNVTEVTIDHPRLQGSNTVRPKGKAPNLKQSTMDFMATTGINYDLGGGWSASLAPTLLVSSGSRHFDRYVQTRSVSTGVDFGLSYRF